MASPSVTYTFTNATTADAAQVNQNFTDILNSLSDSTKSLTIDALTCAGNVAFNANTSIGNATADDLTVTARLASDLIPKTDSTYDLGNTSLRYAEAWIDAITGSTLTMAGDCTFEGAVTINDSGADKDFRVEASGVANALFVQGSDGNVGLGTGSPTDSGGFSRALDIQGSGGASAYFRDSDATSLYLNTGFAGTKAYLWANGASTELSLGTVGTERVLIDASGNMGIGKFSSLGARIHLENASATSIAHAIFNNSSALNGSASAYITLRQGGSDISLLHAARNSAASAFMGILEMDDHGGTTRTLFWDNSGTVKIGNSVAQAAANTGTVVGTQTSDERTKINISPISYGIDTINALRPIEYDQNNQHKLGFGAQTTLPILPEAVYDTGIDEFNDTNNTKLAMEYVQIIPVLVKALQELNAKVEAIKNA